jgi:hypothetical protein
MKLFFSIFIGLIGFAAGALLTMRLLLLAFEPTPADNCPSPCDGPAYLAIGIGFLVAPIVGGLCAWALVAFFSPWTK